mmetsp:Transcript_22328/g.31246  ORF Transcript_22328/g.31246 Transcript_22328/m.31246 type:complete len:395 (-) Transcript_22328:280-1464(-)|eukprot:CAMPEP_0184481994 /NCGR_PEP_ID=MMETSP0113_2-20130426/3578_1 /TAXON_ID=91329 /ORGANISM="Norrisiella sphaerica, Strain BC52" /LENGTH=394 /DNA_ID=CAMNT_0026861495 /DNA_START=13 /DNA_END=1197 /DNA_ORIENTATION=-
MAPVSVLVGLSVVLLSCPTAASWHQAPLEPYLGDLTEFEIDLLPKVYVVDAISEAGVVRSNYHEAVFSKLRELSVDDPAEAEFLFVDVDTHLELLWPSYGGKSFNKSEESKKIKYQRSFVEGEGSFKAEPHDIVTLDQREEQYKIYKRTVDRFASSQSLHAGQRFVLFDSVYDAWNDEAHDAHRAILQDYNLFSISFSMLEKSLQKDGKGLRIPPPVLEDIKLQFKASKKWTERNTFASFIGNVQRNLDVRSPLFDLDQSSSNGTLFIKDTSTEGLGPDEYGSVMADSKFALAPRGDNHYSYRATEALIFGAIPVRYDDKAAKDFSGTPYDMDNWSVTISENEVDQTLQILNSMDESKALSMVEEGKKVVPCVWTISGHVKCMLEAMKCIASSN